MLTATDPLAATFARELALISAQAARTADPDRLAGRKLAWTLAQAAYEDHAWMDEMGRLSVVLAALKPTAPVGSQAGWEMGCDEVAAFVGAAMAD